MPKQYIVHEAFLTVQGEGAHIGRTAVFIRFAGCNLWSGREEDRARAICQFCDTRFVGGTGYTAAALADVAAGLWVGGGTSKFAVLTGGEPMLQFDADLFLALRRVGFHTIAMETNGSVPLPADIRPDWLCVSPKAGALLVVRQASELKLVYPQKGLSPEDLSEFTSGMRWLSPMDGPNRAENTKLAADYCLRHPAWRLAIQAHKTWGLP